jgi:IS1 family transposase
MGGHTAYVERTHLTSRQMNRRLARKTLSFSKELELLERPRPRVSLHTPRPRRCST